MKSGFPAGVGEMPCAMAGHAGVPDLWRMEQVRRDSTVEKEAVVLKVMRVAKMGVLSFWGAIVTKMVKFQRRYSLFLGFEMKYV